MDGGQARGIVAGKARVGGERVGVHLHLVAHGLQAGNAALERGLVAHRARRGVDVDVPGAVRVIAVIVAAVVGVVRHSG